MSVSSIVQLSLCEHLLGTINSACAVHPYSIICLCQMNERGFHLTCGAEVERGLTGHGVKDVPNSSQSK